MNRKHLAMLFIVVSTFNIWIFSDEMISNSTFASYYGEPFHGRPTASGEIFDMNAYTAAHKTLPFGTMLEVTNLENGKSVVVKINDRGPFVGNREIDLSRAAAEVLGMIGQGIARVSIRQISQQDFKQPEAERMPEASSVAQESPEVEVSPAVPNAKQENLVYVPTTAEETKGVLWRIQVGSFTREENALQLVIKLRDVGFEPAYEKTETHVRVVLYGIRPTDLGKVKEVLDRNNYRGYVIRQESW